MNDPFDTDKTHSTAVAVLINILTYGYQTID